jgi:UBX domain-containing protein 1
MSNIVGLSSLRDRGNDRSGDDSDRDRQQYYAGGASQQGGGSGLSVIGPDGGDGQNADAVANIIERARQQARAGDDMSAADSGAGSGQPRHVITFYRDGFTVNDGPYRARTDPANRPFLEAIEQGYSTCLS